MKKEPSVRAKDEPIVKESRYCTVHPTATTNWRCIECGREFCENGVTPHRHFMSHVNRSASCPECKGRCIDFQHIESLARERQDEINKKRKSVLKLLRAAGIATLLLILFLVFAPIELVVPFLLVMNVLVAVLWLQGYLDVWIGGDSIFSFADDYIDTDSLIPRKDLVIKVIFIIVILSLLFLYFQSERYFPNSFSYLLPFH